MAHHGVTRSVLIMRRHPGTEVRACDAGVAVAFERLEGLGGALTMHSNGDGTRVEACLPIIAASRQL